MDGRPVRALLLTKGHPFNREAFFSMADAVDGVRWTHVEHPAAQVLYRRESAEPYDVFVDYSMPGVPLGRQADQPPRLPPEGFRRDVRELMEAGTHGFVFLHHSLCSWPAWDEYAEMVGGRFLFHPGVVRGAEVPESGYLLGAASTYVVVADDHPVTRGLPPTFELQDELFMAHVFEDDVVPLVRSDFAFTDDRFFSPHEVTVHGRMYSRRGWTHPPTSNAVCWIKHHGQSPVVYIQPGDVPSSYGNPAYRLLLRNAIHWAASDEAHRWARARAAGEDVDPVPDVEVAPSPLSWPAGADPGRRAPDDGKRCLFCAHAGVERYDGAVDRHRVARGEDECRGPLCGNCHVMLLDDGIDSGGWRLADAS